MLASVIKFLIAIIVIGWLVVTDKLHLGDVVPYLTSSWFIVGLFLMGLNLYFCSERWRLLLNTFDFSMTKRSMYKLTLIGNFFNFIMPGGVGGDLVKAVYLHKNGVQSKTIALGSVLVDRIIGLYTIILICFIAMVVNYEHVSHVEVLMTLFKFVILMTTATTLGLFLLLSRGLYIHPQLQQLYAHNRLLKKISGLHEQFTKLGQNPSSFFKMIFLSFMAQICTITLLWCAGQSLMFEAVSFKTYFLVAPLGFMATAIPISPAGVGVGQAAFFFLFNVFTGQESQVGTLVITAFQITLFIYGLIGAFFYIRFKKAALPVDSSSLSQPTS